jgi:hypothetical protein
MTDPSHPQPGIGHQPPKSQRFLEVSACLPSCLAPGERPRYEPVRYGEYVMECIDKNYSYHHAANVGAAPATVAR